jgi:hypothetical protein
MSVFPIEMIRIVNVRVSLSLIIIQMNKIIFTLVILFSTLSGFSQDFDRIIKAFSEGNVSQLSPILDATVDLSVDDRSAKLGRSDAENQLRSFFMIHTPRSMKAMHKGVSENDVHYMISQLMTSDGAYRVTVYIYKSGESYLVQSIEIEKEE